MDSVRIAGDQRELEEKIGYFFKDKDLLSQSLTHSSYANERKTDKKPDYERLEFLGDRVFRRGEIYGNLDFIDDGVVPDLKGNLYMNKVMIPSQRIER